MLPGLFFPWEASHGTFYVLSQIPVLINDFVLKLVKTIIFPPGVFTPLELDGVY